MTTLQALPLPSNFEDLCELFLLYIAYSTLGWCGEITISGAVTFDLNGYTLTCNATDEDMFCVYDGKTLTIKDSGTDGTIDGQNKNCGFSVSSGTLILESSIIANCRDDDGDGGAVDIGKDCVFTMRGGTISNCNGQHEGGAI